MGALDSSGFPSTLNDLFCYFHALWNGTPVQGTLGTANQSPLVGVFIVCELKWSDFGWSKSFPPRSIA